MAATMIIRPQEICWSKLENSSLHVRQLKQAITTKIAFTCWDRTFKPVRSQHIQSVFVSLWSLSALFPESSTTIYSTAVAYFLGARLTSDERFLTARSTTSRLAALLNNQDDTTNVKLEKTWLGARRNNYSNRGNTGRPPARGTPAQ